MGLLSLYFSLQLKFYHVGIVDGAASAPAPKRPNVQMPDEYLPPNKILFLQNLPENVTKDQLMALFSQYIFSIFWFSPYSSRFSSRYPNLYEVRLIPTKRDIAFVEFIDEGSAGVAKDALHNYKLDGENKIKVSLTFSVSNFLTQCLHLDHLCEEIILKIGFRPLS